MTLYILKNYSKERSFFMNDDWYKKLKVASIVHSVFLQECHDRNYPVDYNRVMGDNGYLYDNVNMERFLLEIKIQLAHLNPALNFTFNTQFVTFVLADTYPDLVGHVDSHTT
jgi:hypothetical protein